MSEESKEEHVGDLDVLLATEQTFPPPPEFVAQANASDPGIYERANDDPEAWWGSWAEKLDWIEPCDEILDWSDPPFAKWFTGGKLNVSANCLDRHVAAGRGERIAYYWEGEDGTRKEITYAGLLDQVQRFANGLRSLGIGKGDVVGIYMPMVPEAAVGDARLRADRRDPQRRLRRLLRRLGGRADGGLRRQGADHRRRDAAARQADADEGGGRRGDRAISTSLEHVIVVNRGDTDPPMTDGRDLFWHELLADADAECPPEPMDAEDPLFILYTSGSTAQAEGHPAHDRAAT